MVQKRRSRQRDLVLQVLKSTTSHPTAAWIYEQVRSSMPDISLGTVYRNLKLLEKEGVILELDYGSGFARYDGNPENHDHFKCDRCGAVFDLHESVDREMDGRIAKKTGFVITYHRLEFRGLCPDCLKAAKTSQETVPTAKVAG